MHWYADELFAENFSRIYGMAAARIPKTHMPR